ncbi:pirin family protein [Agrobacterium tumefaciens]|uniref:pirin family protein n=1 Tax=Agrobacterium tumefaciens TaxID=358 RepID=UPI0021CE6D1E|nr:pirin family protein [Agrobacterium tumefaciens]NTZ61397.1 pirin family protein [Agrobacterium tumefaciens]UXT00204.1 pirin family protein [Agrobacterium tumefaciens]UXT52904.1 pirin family protein [Agrobacterium tumefaciens]
MATIVRLQRAHCGSHYRASGLCGGDTAVLIDPFLGVDHIWTGAPACPPRPHAGYSVASYVFLDSETAIRHSVSPDAESMIAPGGLIWTAAGRGIVQEDVPAETGRTAHMLQIFVSLPRAQQNAAPFALKLSPQDVPVVRLPGVKIRVPLGAYGDARSPLAPPTDVDLLDILIEEGSGLTVPVTVKHTAFVMAVYGTPVIDDERFDSNELRLPVFSAQQGSRNIRIEARHGRARAVVFSGLPLRQPMLRHGSMAPASAHVPPTLSDRHPVRNLGAHRPANRKENHNEL